MNRLSLVPSDHPALWRVADPVTDFTGIETLSNRMIRLAIKSRGIGLAAPQCGISQQVFVALLNLSWTVCVNPVILQRGPELVSDYEGCLSFPGQHSIQWRNRALHVQYRDARNVRHDKWLYDMDARVWDHEYDHILGVTIFPSLRPVTVPDHVS